MNIKYKFIIITTILLLYYVILKLQDITIRFIEEGPLNLFTYKGYVYFKFVNG